MNSRNVRTPLGIARRGFFCQFEAIRQEAVEGTGWFGAGKRMGCESFARPRGAFERGSVDEVDA